MGLVLSYGAGCRPISQVKSEWCKRVGFEHLGEENRIRRATVARRTFGNAATNDRFTDSGAMSRDDDDFAV